MPRLKAVVFRTRFCPTTVWAALQVSVSMVRLDAQIQCSSSYKPQHSTAFYAKEKNWQQLAKYDNKINKEFSMRPNLLKAHFCIEKRVCARNIFQENKTEVVHHQHLNLCGVFRSATHFPIENKFIAFIVSE